MGLKLTRILYLDINECDTSNSPTGKCGANALCSNSPGGFSCTCQPGFTGDPFVNCYGKLSTYSLSTHACVIM